GELLADLSEEDWTRPTAAKAWSVKDVVAHLLQGDVGVLSRCRDAFHQTAKPVERHEDLVSLVNDLNAQWVCAARGLSPRVLRELLSFSGTLVEEYFASLDPFAMSGPVSWAGPDPAPVWLDLAREFTERWHHQQQIRDATNRPPLYEPYFLAPVLDAFVRALPYSFRIVEAKAGSVVKLEIAGDAGGVWYLRRNQAAWELFAEVEEPVAAHVVIPQDAAWRLFTKGLSPEQARATAMVQGDARLAAQIFGTIAIIG
ncbi:MAG TPA: maleylpyruvate isomerase N-terminal domain-containing protein, partial [Thermoanaerobaculia bacterium]|nr:maleylpyruvate isomerase N-terminal domain-containing protein [Thermoanaerobaculia bacterium]